MPKRVDSDEEDSTLKKKRPTRVRAARGKTETALRNPELPFQKAKVEQKNSLISTWARREEFASQEVIEDVEIAYLQKANSSVFPVDHGNAVRK